MTGNNALCAVTGIQLLNFLSSTMSILCRINKILKPLNLAESYRVDKAAHATVSRPSSTAINTLHQ